jgi:hypothetical protein
MALSNIQQDIERSIFEIIRLKLVEEGYLANIKSYTQNQNGANAYKAANNAIASTKGFYIEIFGAGSQQAKGEKTVPRIIIQPQRALPGDIGQPITSIEKGGNSYTQFKHPFTTSNYQIDIKAVWNTVVQYRIINAILAETVSTRNYIPFYNAAVPTDNFFMENLNTGYDASDSEQGTTESVYMFQITDINLRNPQTIKSNGPLITQITTEIRQGIPNNSLKIDEINTQ